MERTTIIHGALALFAVAIVGKAAQVQLAQRDQWRARARQLHFTGRDVPAPRGTITDASGRVLVESRELVRLRVAPNEVKNRAALGRALAKAGVKSDVVRRATDSTVRWVEVPGTFLPTDVATITAMRGVHPEAVVQRVFSGSEGTHRVVGRVGPDGAPVDGVELSLDSLLRGVQGRAAFVRYGSRGALESPFAQGEAPRAGKSITLTLNAALQDICERALADAAKLMNADGGDIVVMNPRTGEILALATERPNRRTTSATTISEPFEPGSTVKPFVAARLLDLKRARPDEVINTENGQWTINKRTITDEHKRPSMPLTDVITYSSNIGIVKFAQRLAPREQFELLRDLGFGAPTGVPYPAEARGTLRAPTQWTAQSPASLAMGYEMAVTPLQLAAAYASIANGGNLVEPALVREVRTPEGDVAWRHEPRVVRRVMSEATARTMRQMLGAVVDSGTGTAVNLPSYTIGGKSGTARRTENGRYAPGHYNALFAGMFPLEDPQYVIVVKIDNPRGDSYYGGKTAGPVMKVVLQAALASRDAALDREKLQARVLPKAQTAYTPKPSPADTAKTRTIVAAPVDLRRDSASADSFAPRVVRYVVDLPARPTAVAAAIPPRQVPAVQGLPVRDALYALHRAGFRVRLAAGGPAGRTTPEAGAMLPAGTSVTLYRTP